MVAKHAVVALLTVMLGAGVAGCAKKSSSSNPPAKKTPANTDDANGNGNGNGGPGNTVGDTAGSVDNFQISPLNQTGTTFTYDQVTAISIPFQVARSLGHSLSVALVGAPTGMTLTGGTSTNPVLVWSSPVKGTYNFSFLLRDMDACSRALGASTSCALGSTATAAQGSYDMTSAQYTLVVGGSNADASSLISQILNGVGNGSGTGLLADLLQNLTTGQLQEVLQGQSSGLDLAALLDLITGFNLQATDSGDEG